MHQLLHIRNHRTPRIFHLDAKFPVDLFLCLQARLISSDLLLLPPELRPPCSSTRLPETDARALIPLISTRKFLFKVLFTSPPQPS